MSIKTLLQTILYSSTILLFSACGGDNNEINDDTNETQTCLEEAGYETVELPNGHIWLDRSVGASAVGEIGTYYTKAEALGACPCGFVLIKKDDMLALTEEAIQDPDYYVELDFAEGGYIHPTNGLVNEAQGYYWIVNEPLDAMLTLEGKITGTFGFGLSASAGLQVRCIDPDTQIATSITHNGTTYGFVTSSKTGRVWLDRNLGADRVCTSFDDIDCYGDYYQWGRNFDGHQDSTSDINNAKATNVDNVGHGDLIIVNGDWASVDSTGSTRSANWSKTDGSSVCPVGFRVPNISELKADTLNNGITNRDTAFTSFLKLPSAGYRSRDTISSINRDGYFWSLSPTSDDSGSYVEYGSSVVLDEGYREYAYSIRCLKN
jgi:hypothetical protein